MYTFFEIYDILFKKGGLFMTKILLNEIVIDYMNRVKMTIPTYGVKSFADKCGLSRAFLYKLIDGQYGNNFSDKVIESISNTIGIKKEILIKILESDNGKELYYQRLRLLKAFDEIIARADNAELEVYLSLMQSIENKL